MEIEMKILHEGAFYTVFYNLFRSSFLTLYKKITVIGRENIKKNEAVLITPNHQNSMMDAMAILFTTPRPHPYFVARADIFKKKFVSRVLHSLKMLPIYRIRDGKENLKNNELITQKTIKVLEAGVPFTIYPEGNHDGHRRFRGAKKGVVRTAFAALESFPEGKQLYIVPTGIEYNTSYEKAMQDIVVFYGKPICVNDFLSLYLEDKARAERQLQLKIQERMSDQMINIQSLEYYDLYDVLRELSCGDVMKARGVKRNPEQKLYAQQAIIKALDAALEKDETPFAALKPKAETYYRLLKQWNLRDWLFDQKRYRISTLLAQFVGLLLLSPYAVFGRLSSGLQYAFIDKMANKNKDPQWRSSVRFIMGFTLMPISHLLLASIVFFSKLSAWCFFPALILLAFGGYFSLHYEVWFKKFVARVRYNRLMKQPKGAFKTLLDLRAELNDFVHKQMDLH